MSKENLERARNLFNDINAMWSEQGRDTPVSMSYWIAGVRLDMSRLLTCMEQEESATTKGTK